MSKPLMIGKIGVKEIVLSFEDGSKESFLEGELLDAGIVNLGTKHTSQAYANMLLLFQLALDRREVTKEVNKPDIFPSRAMEAFE